MKIERIKAKNFMGFDAVDIVFGLVTIITGINGAGKSRLGKDIFKFVLGVMLDRNPVSWGEKSAEVMLQSGKVVMTRKQTASGSKDFSVVVGGKGISGTPADVELQLYRQLNVTDDQIEALLETGQWLYMDSGRRKDTIFKALKLSITKEILLEYLNSNGPEIDWEKLVEERQVFDRDTFDFDEIDINNAIFTNLRREEKRLSKELSTQLDRYLDVEVIDTSKRESFVSLLNNLKSERDQLVSEKGAVGAGDTNLTQARIDGLKKELNKPDNTKAIEKIDAEIKAVQFEIDTLNGDLSAMRDQSVKVKTQMTALEEQARKIKNIDGDCPTCGRKMTQSAATKALNEIEKEMRPLMQINASETEHFEKLKAEIRVAAKNIEELMSERAKLKSEQLSGNRKDLQLQIEQLESSLESMPTADKLDAINAEISSLDQRIAKGQEMIDKVDRYAEAQKNKADIESRLADSETMINAYDLLEKAYGDKGIKAQMLSNALARIETKATELVKTLGFESFTFYIRKEGRAEVFAYEIDGRLESEYSEAQRHAFSIIVQMVLAQLSGLKFLVIENLYKFVNPLRQNVNTLIFGESHSFDTIILLSATDVKPVKINQPDLVQYHIENGRVERL